MCLEIGRVDYDRLIFSAFGGQTDHDTSEDTVVAPAPPSVIKGLRRAVLLWRIIPAQAIAIYENIQLRTRQSSTRGFPWLL